MAKRYSAVPVLVYVDTPYDLVRQRRKANDIRPTRLRIHDNNFEYVLAHYERPIQEDHIVFRVEDTITEWIEKNL